MVEIFNVLGDTHNHKYLKITLSKFDNIISIGDISFILEKEEFSEIPRFGACTKAYINNKVHTLSKEDNDWFRNILLSRWKKQLDLIKNSGKNFTLCIGNADYYLINYFKEGRAMIIEMLKLNNFELIEKPELRQYEGVQMLFLPFSYDKFNLKNILNKIDSNKKLFVLGHCPPYENHKKEYYINYFNTLKEISIAHPSEFIYIHSHIHPDNTYEYSMKSIPNMTIMSPKANDTDEGFGVENHLIEVNTRLGSCKIIDTLTEMEVESCNLPEEYLEKEHWNKKD